ncbi:MAG: NADH-quinone oxidoreductase subunit C [bacterium]
MNEIIIQKLKEQFSENVESTNEFRGDLTVQVKKNSLLKVGEFLKSDPELAFDLIVDVLGVDMYKPEGRFEVIYNLYSIKNNKYLRLKIVVEEDDCSAPSVTSIWTGADWHERETYDMFGIKFTGHPDLRRMYMPEEYQHFPLRKDFPLMGIPDSIPLPRK